MGMTPGLGVPAMLPRTMRLRPGQPASAGPFVRLILLDHALRAAEAEPPE